LKLVSQNEPPFEGSLFGLFAIQNRCHTFIFITWFEKVDKSVVRFLCMKEIISNVWQVEGSLPGPQLVVLGGIHGDELTGIEVVKILRDKFLSGELVLKKGTLTLALGNEAAIKSGVRGTDGRNLNRLFSKKLLAEPAEDFYESKRAQTLAPFLNSADILLDLHATYCPSKSFLACAASSRHEKVFRWFDTDLVLTDPNYVTGGEAVTTDELVDGHGGIGICFEAGWQKDLSLIPTTLKSVLSVLVDQEMIELSESVEPPKNDYKIFEVVRKVILTEVGFRYSDSVSLASFAEVKKDQVLGYHGETPELAEADGVLVFQKAEAQWQLGHPVFFFAKRIR
jgi:succinylglutamate desuccinylase